MREIIYNITQQTAGRVVVVSGLDEELTKDNVLGIINKTQSQVLYTPVQAANMLSASYQDGTMTISLADNVPNINQGDELFVKLYSDKEIDFSAFAKESTLNAVSSKLDNLNVDVDLSIVAKQGSNADATNSAIYSTLNEIKDDVIDIMKLTLEEVDNLLDL